MTRQKYEQIRQFRICKKVCYAIALFCVILGDYYFMVENFRKVYFDQDYDFEYTGNGDLMTILFPVLAVLWWCEGRYICRYYYMKMYDIRQRDLYDYEQEPKPIE